MAQILVVDDEEGVRSFLADTLRLTGHVVTEAEDGAAAIVHLRAQHFHVVLTDLKMPRVDGLGVLAEARLSQPEAKVILLSAHGSIETAVGAMRNGAFDFLTKPLESPGALRRAVERALEHHRLQARVEGAAHLQPPPLCWGDPAMAPTVEALKKVAATEATVLLLGESGVGKEVAAQTLHRLSKRAEGPFVALNCAALSDNLLESELFGFEKGAFTGAAARKRGKIELAEGGTFFLDEVGELRPELQARLLRVLQERRFERVGGTQTVVADVRWVAATNRDLQSRVREGSFREDLYWRLNVFPLTLPPLRARRQDLVPLARHLLSAIGRELGRGGLSLSPMAEAQTLAHGWPGNVRELRNTLERAAILSDSDQIEDLALPLPAVSPPPPGSLEDLEKSAIQSALAACDGHRRKAAERLGIGERTLYDKLKRYGLAG